MASPRAIAARTMHRNGISVEEIARELRTSQGHVRAMISNGTNGRPIADLEKTVAHLMAEVSELRKVIAAIGPVVQRAEKFMDEADSYETEGDEIS
jgi:predicted transcriptional regulator